jgi:hypothetical protein
MKRYFKSPNSKRKALHCYCTWNNASIDQLKRSGKIRWILLIVKATLAGKKVLETFFYINSEVHFKWASEIKKRQIEKEFSDVWFKLYIR